jgi:hypothetical protein
MSDTTDITGLLVAWRGGDQAAFDRLFPLVYDDLRQMVHGPLRLAALHPRLLARALRTPACVRADGVPSPRSHRATVLVVTPMRSAISA